MERAELSPLDSSRLLLDVTTSVELLAADIPVSSDTCSRVRVFHGLHDKVSRRETICYLPSPVASNAPEAGGELSVRSAVLSTRICARYNPEFTNSDVTSWNR